MSYNPCRERVFPLWLAYHAAYRFSYYAHWLRHILERLGREPALRVWQNAFQDYDDGLLVKILSAEWKPVAQDERLDFEGEIAGHLSELFPEPVEAVSAEQAQEIIESSPPFSHIRQCLSDVNVMRDITTYDALHLFHDGVALLVESLVELFGKQGELIAYDGILAELASGQTRATSVNEFMSNRLSRFSSEPEEADMYSAGLEVEVVRGSETEVVTHVKECEWARYYQDRHPKVGYLLACSLDNAVYESFNPSIRLQRTSTLMEGGEMCDFRVYALAQSPNT